MLVGGLVVLLLTSLAFRACSVVDKVADPNHILYTDEEFNRQYQAILAMCNQLSDLESLPDETSGGFSKTERVLAIKNKISAAVAHYNQLANSVSTSLWKNSNLPKTITDPCN